MTASTVRRYSSENEQPAPRVVPKAVQRVRMFFWVTTWIGLIVSTVFVVSQTTDGDYSYFIPVGLYALCLLFFQWKIAGGARASSASSWGSSYQFRKLFAFILISFVLIAWMTHASLSFQGMYLALLGQTVAMVSLPLAIPLVGAEITLYLYPVGFLQISAAHNFLDGDFWVAAILILTPLPLTGVIGLLMRSRVRSEMLVQELKATQRQLEEVQAKEREVAVLRERERMAREMHDLLAFLANLHSPILKVKDTSLIQALQEWAGNIACEGHFAIFYQFVPEIVQLSSAIQNALWGVSREAILNIFKHASATEMKLAIFFQENAVSLLVSDNGVGIRRLSEGNARFRRQGGRGGS